jgi:hypothetical protein
MFDGITIESFIRFLCRININFVLFGDKWPISNNLLFDLCIKDFQVRNARNYKLVHGMDR